MPSANWAIFRDQIYRIAKEFKQGQHNPRYDTSDITQEGLVQVLNFLQTPGRDASMINRSLLRRIVHGHACNLHRYHSAQRRSVSQTTLLESGATIATDSNPTENLHREETRIRLLEAIAGLPDSQRFVLSRRLFDKSTYQQIALEMDVSIDVVRTRYKNAVKALRTSLAND